MKIIGLDLSLTNTGVAIIEDGKLVHSCLIKSKPQGDRHIDELKRILGIVNSIVELMVKPDLVVIENLAFMAQGTSLTQLAGLSYIVRSVVMDMGAKFVLVAPSTLKKFITGKGNGDKNLVLMEVYKRWDVSFTNDNEADSFGLAQIGVELLASNELPQFQKEVIELLKKQL